MIGIGNFFSRYRNFLFIFLYALLFIPSPRLFGPSSGEYYWVWPLSIGLFITIPGQAVRGAAIGLAYIVRGGKDGKVYAEELVTEGMFSHCRNPLYVGNILMLAGVAMLRNSMIYVCAVIPVFLFIYQAIVLAEEDFLSGYLGDAHADYCIKVNRWLPSVSGLSQTFKNAQFNWKRWILKEYNTQYVWLSGITLILLLYYPQLTSHNERLRNVLLAVILPFLLLVYLFVRYLKKSGRIKE